MSNGKKWFAHILPTAFPYGENVISNKKGWRKKQPCPRWFKVTFSSPSWRSLNPLQHLTIPKRLHWITMSFFLCFKLFHYFKYLKVFSFLAMPWVHEHVLLGGVPHSYPHQLPPKKWNASRDSKKPIPQLMVNCWFGARWFGFLRSPYEREGIVT